MPHLRHARLPFLVVAVVSSMCLTSVSNAAAPADQTAADYEAAKKLLQANLHGLVRNESVQPHWLDDSGRFWYQRDGDDGPELVVVTATGAKAPAFDHAAIARAIAEALGERIAGSGMPASLSQLELNENLTRLTAKVGERSVDCDLKALRCRAFEVMAPSTELLLSPDGRWAALTRDDNLFVREIATGRERQLTTDGAPFYSWAKLPDSSLLAVARKKLGVKVRPFETYWSPDAGFLITPRVDERRVAVYPYVEWVPTDGSKRPIVHEVRLAFGGDCDVPKNDYFLFDLQTGRRFAIQLPEGYEHTMFDGLVLGWSQARRQAFLFGRTLGSKSAAVFRMDLATGSVTKVVEESSATRVETNTNEYNRPNIQVLGDGAELVWYSDRTGWGHLYLYDAQTGRLKNAITQGTWLVNDVHAVDEKRREIYFTGSGREEGRDPYYRHLYRASLDGNGDVTLLTPPNADHHFDASPSPGDWQYLVESRPHAALINPPANVFVDTWSTVDRPPISVLRSTRDGHVITEIERANASRLYAVGWSPPVRERVKTADGTTDLFAAYYAPYGMQPGKKYPIIDAAYGGPMPTVAPRNFVEAYRGYGSSRNSLVRLGFGVIAVDGRGTAGRSRAFRDAGYPEFTQVGIDDHVAAIRELARRYAEMDLHRVGVYGWSWGGTFAAQAILSRREFYKVAVSGAGMYDYAASYRGAENWTGVPVYADGANCRRGKHDDVPANWEKLDVTRLAARLSGRLLIIYADLDEFAPPHQAFRLVEALTRANKSYDLIYLPNRTHAGVADGYTIKRTWDYFMEHLQGVHPVRDVAVNANSVSPLAPVPITPGVRK